CQTGLLAVPEALGTMLQVVTEGVKRRHPKQPATLDIYKQERGKFFSNILHACKYQVPASSMGAGTLHAQCVNAGIPFYTPRMPTRVCGKGRLKISVFTHVRGQVLVVSGQVVGYVRVSAADQNPQRQLEVLGECHKIFTDKISGKSRAKRQALAELLE